MYSVLDKDTIENKIVPHLPEQKRGFPPCVPLSEIISAIFYKLKTGIQWVLLPVKSLFSSTILSWKLVYYHFVKFSVSVSAITSKKKTTDHYICMIGCLFFI